MSWILNKKTGVMTECGNNDVIKICRKDNEGYLVSENVEDLKAAVTKEENEKDKKNPKKMSASELKAYAEQQGIEVTEGLTMKEILALLGE